MRQLVDLQRRLSDLQATGTRLVAISYDSVDTLKKFSDRAKITYPLLSDKGSRVIEAYGIRRTDVKPGSLEDGIPFPGIYLLDRDGIVRAKFFEEGYVRRPTAQDLVDAAAKLD